MFLLSHRRFPHFLLIGLLSLGLGITSTSPVAAEVIKEEFEMLTWDGVNLKGDFYPPKDVAAPVVILLHGKDGSRHEFGKLPEKLQDKGLGVVTFDFRGHGDSWEIDPTVFKKVYPNVPLPPKNKLDKKDFKTGQELLPLCHDVMAIKLWLNLQNDREKCNSHNVCLIGFDQGATIGSLWLAHEHMRVANPPRPMFPVGMKPMKRPIPEGEDVTCCIWVSLNGTLGSSNLNTTLLNLMKNPLRKEYVDPETMETVAVPLNGVARFQTTPVLLRDRVNILVLYGKDDKKSEQFWGPDRANGAFELLKPKAMKEQYDKTALLRKEGTSLEGTKLLEDVLLNTEKSIEDYLLGERKALPKNRQFQKREDWERLPTPFNFNLLGIRF